MTWMPTSGWIGVSLVLSGVFVLNFLAVRLANKLDRVNEFRNNSVELVVAKEEIPIGTQLTPEQLIVVRVPKVAAPQKAFEKVEDLVGRININDIGLQEAITEYRLVPKTNISARWPFPEGYRATTIFVDNDMDLVESIEPGTIVDLVKRSKRAAHKQAMPRPFLKNIRVLATMPIKEAGQANSVTLLLSPEEAERVVMASHDATLHLIFTGFVCRQSHWR